MDYKKVFSASFGNLFAQIITLGTLPVLSRIFSPNEFAVWALILAAGSTVGCLSTFRYDIAIVKEQEKTNASALLIGCVILAAIVSVLLFIVLINPPLSGIILPGAGFGTLTVATFTALVSLLIGVRTAIQQLLVRNEQYVFLSVITLSWALITSAAQIIFGVMWDGSSWALIVGGFMGLVVPLIMCCLSPTFRQGIPREFNSAILFSTLKDHKSFPIYSIPYMVAAVLKERGTLFVIANLVNLEAAGFFQFAHRALFSPAVMLSAGFRPVLYRQYCTGGPEVAGSDLARALRVLIPISVAMGLLGSLYAGPLFSFVFGSEWATAGRYAEILAWPMATLLLINWTDRLFDGSGRQGLALALELGSSIVAMTSLIVPLILDYDAEVALWAFSASLVAYHAIYLFVIRNFLGVIFPVKRLCRNFVVITLCMSLLAYALSCIFPWYGVSIIIAVILSSVSITQMKNNPKEAK